MAIRISRFLRNITLTLATAHAYVGWRLLPALPIDHAGLIAGIGLLVLSMLVMPMAVMGRFITDDPFMADLLSTIGAIAMGLFSSVFVLTVLRDVWLLLPGTEAWRTPGAMAVPLLAVLLTLIGYINARRVPRAISMRVACRVWSPSVVMIYGNVNIIGKKMERFPLVERM